MYAKVSGNNKETPAQKKLPKIYRGPTHDSFGAATGFNTPVWARRKPNSDGRHALTMAGSACMDACGRRCDGKADREAWLQQRSSFGNPLPAEARFGS